MQTQKRSNAFKLTDRQHTAIEQIGSADNVLLYGGSRSTKTFTILRTIVTRALAARNSRHAVLRFRFNHVKASVVYDTFPKVMELCFPQITYKLDKSDWFAMLPNGSEIWFGGLDDKERSEKILGNEYATIFLNECSQISYSSYLILITRLAQVCTYTMGNEIRQLSLKMLLDENPPVMGHWTHKLFIEKKDPISKKPLGNPEDYASLLMNPADNAENLPKSYLARLENLPKRQRDRFWLGKFGDENENALWNDMVIEQSRVNGDDLPEMVRIVVPVDPSGADDDENKNNDDIGIGVIGLGVDGNAYVLEDLTIKAGPGTWGKVVASAYERHEADRVIGEQNFGGAMVEFVVRAANPNISYKAVTASRGKTVRAEPISALHEQGKIKLVGRFDELEDELKGFTTTGYTGSRSPNRADWFVWGVTELFPGLAKRGGDRPEIKIPRARTAAG
jgi:phage terminase large subunit-like protein